ncbi:MAG: hypothetical protein BAA04_10160 [Firmicutes bacterium ZCTH02-B6]|nr:MAG: hypothetical protein BAA04_10160 [Firmicutes bacterium ZCTH02-B6]
MVNADPVRHAVETALRNARAGRDNVCLALTNTLIDARELRLPPMPEGDIKAVIQFELRQLFGGLEDDERLLDFAVVSEHEAQPASPKGGAAKEVLVVSVPRRVVYSYITPLHEARIFPEIVDVGVFSLPLCIPRGGGVVYVHLGPDITNLLLVQNGLYELTRQVELALTPLLEDSDAVSAAARRRAVALVGSAGSVFNPSFPDGRLAHSPVLTEQRGGPGGKTAAEEALEALTAWILETLEFARVRRRAFTVNECAQSVVLSGPVATVPGVAALIEQRVGIPVVLAAPLSGDDGLDFPEGSTPAFALAAAMAYRGLTEL